MNKAIIRTIDEFGRISLPKHMRKVLDIAERDMLAITLKGDAMVIRKYTQSCVFCGSNVELREYMGKYICDSCANSFKNAAQTENTGDEE